MQPHCYIFAPEITPRLRWVVRIFFGRWFHLPIQIVSTAKAVPQGSIVLSYGESLGRRNEIHLPAHPKNCVLNDSKTDDPPIRIEEDRIELYPVEGGDFPIDLFSAAIFCLGRMEEYLEPKRDEHDRVSAKNTHALRYNYLNQAVIDRWFNRLCNLILTLEPQWSGYLQKYPDYHPTIDVDTVWAYRHKGIIKTVGGWIKALVSGRIEECHERIDVLRGHQNDPFDTFNQISQLHEEHQLNSLYFVLSSQNSRFDVQNNLRSSAFQEWLKKMSDKFDIGLHPGYESYSSVQSLKAQKSLLEELSGESIAANRFHYLRFRLPAAYRNLIDAGIEADYTMGYADRTGFRPGTARPYPWYDLEREDETNLMIYPVQSMDTTLNKYMNSSPKEAINVLKNLYLECRKSGGTFRTLWHNSSLSDRGSWKGWKEVYADWLKQYIALKGKDFD